MDTSSPLVAQDAAATSSHTTGRMSAQNERIEVITRGERRRSWTAEQKREIAQESFAPGASVSALARRHQISTGQLYIWRKQLSRGELGGVPQFLRVVASSDGEPPPQAVAPDSGAACRRSLPDTPRSAGTIEIALPNGACVRVGAQADLAMLRQVFAMLAGG